MSGSHVTPVLVSDRLFVRLDVSEASVPASPPVRSGRIYVESDGTVRTGIAIANPNTDDAVISFYFTDKDGLDCASETMRVPARGQISAFLDEAPFNASASARTFTFSSTVSVGAIALRGFANERGDFLMTTLPVAAMSSSMTNVILPHFAACGGWTTEVLLVNSTGNAISGTVTMDDAYPYTIAPRSSSKITSGNPASVQTGTIVISPAGGNLSPVASSVFTFVSGGITVTESGIATTGVSTSFRIFAESSAANSLQTAVAIANTEAVAANVRFELLDLSGQPTSYSGAVTIQPNGHLSLFLNEIQGFQNLPASFRGVLNITSDRAISAIGLRTRYNERHDFLISTMPALPGNAAPATGNLIFPQVVSGSGYTTEFILLNSGGPSQGVLTLTSQSGTEMPLPLLR